MKSVASTLALLVLSLAARELAAQAGTREHWIVIVRAAPGDSSARSVRMTWKGDSLRGEFSPDGRQLMVGAAGPTGVVAEMRNDERAMVQLRGTRWIRHDGWHMDRSAASAGRCADGHLVCDAHRSK